MKYPIGIQSFEDLRENGYVYVDKTSLIYRLVHTGKYYFLSRPRRFGKSLTVSTLEAYFKGKKRLFEGLQIESLEKEWTAYPVLHLDLNSRHYENVDALKAELSKHLEIWESLYDSDKKERALEERFFHVIQRAYEQTGKKVVILVDEYDKPLIQTLGNHALRDAMREVLKAFYSVLKTQDAYIRFGFLTGVTKFSKVSAFSDLNNLADISLDATYETLCGISALELNMFFPEAVSQMAQANGYTVDETLALLKRKYDGYHFSNKMVDIYNPFSLLSAFDRKEFGNYWFETGTPSFLVELLRSNDIPLTDLEGKEMDAEAMGNVDVMFTNPTHVLFQSGYLTIKDYDRDFMIYRLGFPNDEVRDGFMKFILPYYANVDATDVAMSVRALVLDIQRGDVDSFLTRIASFFAGYNYDLIPQHDLERHYQNVLFTITKLIGLKVEAEVRNSAGRMDMLIQTPQYVFIFEFKLNKNATEAIRQINEKRYAARFAPDSRQIIKVGVNFSSEIRGISDWSIEAE